MMPSIFIRARPMSRPKWAATAPILITGSLTASGCIASGPRASGAGHLRGADGADDPVGPGDPVGHGGAVQGHVCFGACLGAGLGSDDAADDVLGVAGDAVEPPRAPGVQPRQAEEVQARDGSDATGMRGVAGSVEYACLHP